MVGAWQVALGIPKKTPSESYDELARPPHHHHNQQLVTTTARNVAHGVKFPWYCALFRIMASRTSSWPLSWLRKVTLLVLPVVMMKMVEGGWIDPETLMVDYVVKSLRDGTEYDLVMSDEFNIADRSFADGDDPTWTAMDHSDDAR